MVHELLIQCVVILIKEFLYNTLIHILDHKETQGLKVSKILTKLLLTQLILSENSSSHHLLWYLFTRQLRGFIYALLRLTLLCKVEQQVLNNNYLCNFFLCYYKLVMMLPILLCKDFIVCLIIGPTKNTFLMFQELVLRYAILIYFKVHFGVNLSICYFDLILFFPMVMVASYGLNLLQQGSTINHSIKKQCG